MFEKALDGTCICEHSRESSKCKKRGGSCNSELRCERKKCKQGKYIKTQELELKEKSKPCSKKTDQEQVDRRSLKEIIYNNKNLKNVKINVNAISVSMIEK